VPFPLKQFFSSYPLGLVLVADLQPGCAWLVGIKLSLRNYTFEIALADKMEQLLTHAFINPVRMGTGLGQSSSQLIDPSMSSIGMFHELTAWTSLLSNSQAASFFTPSLSLHHFPCRPQSKQEYNPRVFLASLKSNSQHHVQTPREASWAPKSRKRTSVIFSFAC